MFLKCIHSVSVLCLLISDFRSGDCANISVAAKGFWVFFKAGLQNKDGLMAQGHLHIVRVIILGSMSNHFMPFYF